MEKKAAETGIDATTQRQIDSHRRKPAMQLSFQKRKPSTAQSANSTTLISDIASL